MSLPVLFHLCVLKSQVVHALPAHMLQLIVKPSNQHTALSDNADFQQLQELYSTAAV